jgi:hypothetical protein
MDITFDTASRFLLRLAVPSYPEIHERLVGLVRVGQILDAFKHCFPGKLPNPSPLTLLDLDGGRLLEIQQAAISAVAALFPVMEDYMDSLVQEDEPLRIHPDSCGFAWDDEYLTEIFENPTDLAPDTDLAMFFKTLWIASTQFGAEEGRRLWNTMQKRFGYPCKLPKVPADLMARNFNWEKVYALLEKDGLGEFKRVIDLALCDTDNLFLDVNSEEYGYGTVEIPDFTAENILELSAVWAEAQEWLADYEHCRQLVLADPQIYARLAKIWEQACKTTPKAKSPKTLIEIFEAEEGAKDGNHPTLA